MRINLLIVLCCGALLCGISSHAQVGPINDSAVVGSPYINAKDTIKKASGKEKVLVESDEPAKKDTFTFVKHSPKKATLLSVFIPGAGQIYNKKYWKPPVIYACFGAAIYGVVFYSREYNNFRQAYITRLNTGGDEDPYYARFQDATLVSNRDYYRYYRDMSYIALGAVYALQILDAAVDAHFYDFKITEDLSLNWQPVINFSGPRPFSELLFTFKF